MDFCQLLHKAKKNDEGNPKTVKYYSTKYEPPKKIQKKNKDLSENIKKFLAKKEAEEQKKLEQELRKKQELLALRSQDKKATRRVNVMIKRTKSANQSVIADAIDQNHTAITRAGAEQPDEDDYGYVSQESAALYEKMMAKYSLIPDEPKFDPFKKKVSLNLNRTREKVKAALEKEQEDALHPRKRRKKAQTEGETECEEKIEKEKKGIKIRAKSKSGPPPLSFMELLKIAEKKQHEPIVIEEKPHQEEEKLYTKKQKKEMEKDREEKERRERRANDMEVKDRNNDDNKDKKPKICSNNNSVDSKTIEKAIIVKPLDKNLKDKEKVPSKPSQKSTNSAFRDMHGAVPVKNGVSSKFSDKQPLKSLSNSTLGNKLSYNNKPIGKSKEFPPRDLISKSKNVPARDNRLLPPNIKGFNKKEPIRINKGRILDDDDEDEYDSELDDFIDDEPQEGDYSNYIKEIFGYDRSRYKDVDEDVDNMESSFAQQMKEEVISAKIGIMEDLEDIKKEENEKRQKMLLKKKMMRR